MKTVSEIRQTFLDYFARNGHEVVVSSALVPHNDPTLMFTNAGMNQFKNVFTGLEQRSYVSAASSQKCVRAGGKHNDLENVGYTARHHTFFEMLGNFSFGDYFKEDAIKHAWELLTVDFGLEPEKLHLTVYHTDDEAFDIWKKVSGFPDNKILRIPTTDNFWSMGDTGPCGPCSEIFYDHGADAAEGEWALDENGHDKFGDRFIEIWNLVFMQYEKHADGTQTSLPKPSIDTGMGLERVAAVLQGKHNNYEIDLFETIISASKNLVAGDEITSHRVVSDHLRSSCFLIADGVLPSNEGRGYVLRRIMRRAMRHMHHLGAKEALFYKLAPVLIAEMGQAYPELVRAQSLIAQTLKNEEERFRETLGRGLKLLDEAKVDIKNDTLAGDVAFKLYDTYGFPLDLTQDILRREGFEVDVAGFDASMLEQKTRAKAAWKGSGEKADDDVWFNIREEHGATEFTGYNNHLAQANIIAIIDNMVVTNQTPFYAESGGQVGDAGYLRFKNEEARIIDTKKKLGQIHVHVLEKASETLKVGDVVELEIDVIKRNQIRANHSATHLMHAVLRKVLGDHVTQKGSLVNAEYLRFDFSHNEPVSAEQLREIELEVNAMIRSNDEVATALMTPEKAQESGAMALFGEKYGDEVRVLSMGYSKELCGGTHVNRTGDIGFFRIISESSIASGVRRIEAITGAAAVEFAQNQAAVLQNLAFTFKAKPEEILPRIAQLQEDKKRLEKELTEAKKKSVGDVKFTEEMLGEVKFISHKFDALPANEMREIAENLRRKEPSSVIAFFAVNDGKLSIMTAIGDGLKGKFDSAVLVRLAAEATGGKGGGGRPELAQAGGVDVEKIADAIAAIKGSI